MKKTMIPLMLAVVFLMALLPSATVAQTKSKKDWTIEFNKKLTKESVEGLVEDMKRRHVVIEFEEIKYSPGGKLRKIKGTVTCADGAYGAFFHDALIVPKRYVKITRTHNSNGVAGRIQVDTK